MTTLPLTLCAALTASSPLVTPPLLPPSLEVPAPAFTPLDDGGAVFLGRHDATAELGDGADPVEHALAFLERALGRTLARELSLLGAERVGAHDLVLTFVHEVEGREVDGERAVVLVADEAVTFARVLVRPANLADVSAGIDASAAGALAAEYFATRAQGALARPERKAVWRGSDQGLRPAYRVEVDTQHPFAWWTVLLDAVTGEVVSARELGGSAVSGDVRFTVDAQCQGAGTELVGMPNVHWNASSAADDRGHFFDAGAVAQAQVRLDSPYFALQNQAGALAGPWSFNLAQEPAVNALDVTTAPLDQVSPFYFAHKVRAWLRGRLDQNNSQKSWSEQKVPIKVNIPENCNAFYDGTLNFFQAGSGCLNTGRVSTIVFHEYGHGIHDHSGSTFDGQVSEGISDFVAATINNSPLVTGLTGCGSAFRTCSNSFTYCGSGCTFGPASEVHEAGQVICAVFWKLREQLIGVYGRDLGVATAERIFLKYLTLVGNMSSSYSATIAADDDEDNNPANGTKHSCEINKAFADDTPGATAHFPELAGKIPSLPSLTVQHQAPGYVDAKASGAPTLRFTMKQSQGCAPTGALSAATLHYRLADSTPRQVALTKVGTSAEGDVYEAALTNLEAPATIDYYVTAKLGTVDFVYPYQPPQVPRDSKWPYYRQSLRFATDTVRFSSDFEASDGGLAAGTSASDGESDFEWGAPNGLGGDPSKAVSGTRIWGTDLATAGDGQYDRAHTSFLDLPSQDLRGTTEVRLQFWRVLVSADVARIEVNGRRAWENRAGAFFWRDPVWTFQDLDITHLAAGEQDVRVRFVMTDEFRDSFELGGWNIDDVRVVTTGGSDGAGEDEEAFPGFDIQSTGCSATSGNGLLAVLATLGLAARSLRRRTSSVVSAAAALLLTCTACVDVELCVAPCTDPPTIPHDDVVALTGTACTVEPNAVLFPYKVLFVIDVSGSNLESDPADNRARALQAVIDQYIENRAVSFAVMSFSTEAEPLTAGFVRDYSTLVPDVINSVKRKNGGTNYTDALKLAYDIIQEDALQTPEAERARTRYDIQWLSDGIPDPCVRPGPILAMTDDLLALREKYGFFDLRMSTIRLFHPGYPVDGCTDLTPTDYLQPMAEHGEGTFQQLSSSELNFQINFTEIYRRFESRQFFIVNENRIVWDEELWPDSDGDGLRDMDELGDFDPLRADANRDGCTDRVNEELLPNRNLCADYCTEALASGALTDRDRDGIPDCAEQTLGYKRLSADSDKDGFGDLLELKLRTNALDRATLTLDSDRDGELDADEIRLGTNPRFPERSQSFRYQYSPLRPTAASGEPGTSCFEFSIDNVRLVHTQATESSLEGDNLLCLYLVQNSVDDPEAEPTVTRACKTARYIPNEDGDFKLPADGILRIEPRDFFPLD